MKNAKIVKFIKEHSGLTLISILVLSLGVYYTDYFFIILLLYIYIIKIFLSDFLQEKIKKYVATIIWTTVIIVGLLVY
ncbi:MAG: hypothetical protein US25_C0083G0001 [Candidatus Moranbacteria bacterium GW2011_GWE1_36_7]|nr:MAG: hypothetical protein UR99_C0066G0001 [Candidatus Moranbacteria bacterium GW2011_GWD2_36_12]KKQ04535.1 MAG: hypothetical protein US16_C0055G0001 [Candidatus Moranbacteria bacterium GW2011_GWE2_36_40]KKQ11474.1 MAG: hypothetical protein US25_C0083G0001 [Candidatus Moranbacteria bacterium GW2011_GWE1_36_7]